MYKTFKESFSVENRNRTNISVVCDLCGAEYFDNRSVVLGKRRRYCSDKCRNRASYIRQHYRLDARVYFQMWEQQGGLCAICERPFEDFSVDHDHRTNQIRGLLCMTCNSGLGCFKDNLDWLENAGEYVKSHAEGTYPQNKTEARLGKCAACAKRFVQTRPDRKVCSSKCGTKYYRMRNRDKVREVSRDYYERTKNNVPDRGK